ncbi:MAG: acetate kinase [Candidatus Westeberhardia cardiocondylae]|nr:acetate kinase [Candidatus Westeberhardia cardiocondylae]
MLFNYLQWLGVIFFMSNKLILILNCGSSSIKFSVFGFVDMKKYLFGVVEFFSFQHVHIQWQCNGAKKCKILDSLNSLEEILDFVIDAILMKELKILGELFAVGHRIVHGGPHFIESVIIDANVLRGIKSAISFAPLHNPFHLIGIKKIFAKFPNLLHKSVAVFDTAFHQSIPEESYLYPLPYFLYKKYGIRRYGAHGISHSYVLQESTKFLSKSRDSLNIITCHLGNGSSISAIRNGRCVDTSMGLTPLEGLVMGTRCGDIDPSIVFYLYEHLNMSLQDIKKIFTEQSGLLGLSGGISHDCRDIEKNYFNVSSSSHRAINVFCYRLSKYIGAYSVLMEGKLDALVFTGGIGENSVLIRKLTLQKVKFLNFILDDHLNSSIRYGKSGIITTSSSCPVIVIPTNEDLVIAKDVVNLLK